jgi:phosphatidylethanolamine/phosphatidyl-N-methylethanolamine N-methyltransferase
MLSQQLHVPHRTAFFRSWLRDPFNVASVVPSSKSLARLMACDLSRGARVVELGAGTGTLTEAILARGVDPGDLVLVERCAAFVGILERRFPKCTVLQTDAAELEQHLGALRGTVDYVVSGLPILWFNGDKKASILTGAFALLRPTGRLHQFTYLGRPPVGGRLLSRLGIKASLLGVSPINLPPAFVYRFEREPAIA